MKSRLDGLALRRVGFKEIRCRRLTGIRLRRSSLRSVIVLLNKKFLDMEQICVTKGVDT